MFYYIKLKINNENYALKIPFNDTKMVFDVTAVIINSLKPDYQIDIDTLQGILHNRFNYDVSLGKIISEINYPL